MPCRHGMPVVKHDEPSCVHEHERGEDGEGDEHDDDWHQADWLCFR
jgi:hypothetical protein